MSLKKSIDNFMKDFPIKNKSFVKTLVVTTAGVALSGLGFGVIGGALLAGAAIYEYSNSNHSDKNLAKTGGAILAGAIASTGPVGLIAAAVYGAMHYQVSTDKSSYYGRPAEQKLVEKVTKTFSAKR